jgi:hypothetical protein
MFGMFGRAWLASFAIACGRPAPPPAPPATPFAVMPDAAIDAPLALEDDAPRLAARAVALYEGWRQAIETAGLDCAMAAAGLDEVALAHADVIAANREVVRAGGERLARLRAALASHQARLDAAARAIFEAPALAACAQDPEFARAFEQFGGNP